MTAYAEINEFGEVLQQLGFVDPDGFVGPDDPVPENEYGCTYRKLSSNILWVGKLSATSKLLWPAEDAHPAWVETATLEQIQSRAIAAIDHEADASRLRVVGDAARIKEYERAEQQAIAFRDAGFAGDAPPSVACWAEAKQWTPQQAAEDILAAAARWLAALDGIRALRLQAKEDVRRAVRGPEVEAIHANFSATLTTMMQGV